MCGTRVYVTNNLGDTVSVIDTATDSVTATITVGEKPTAFGNFIGVESKCPSAKLYGEYSEETELLRYLRDNVLSQTPVGQELIRLYYQWSPVIVKAMEEDEEFKGEVKEIIDGVLQLIEESVE